MRPCRGGRGGGCRSALASEEAPTAEALGAEAAIHQSPTEGDEALDEGAPGVSPVAAAYSGLAAPIVRADVPLSSDADALEVLVGSFASDGLTFAIQPDGTACLVAAAPDALPDGAPALAIPASVEHAGATYEVAAIGAHAFSLCGTEAVVLPASVASVDEDALWPASVQHVEVDAANPSYASYDGILYDAALTRLLSIPGGRQGAVRISDKAEEVETSVFSHCAGVDAVSVDAGGANLASWDGLLYDADGTTLLRVPAGATDVTIRDGCTTVAAGALEGCTSLETITAPASVTSVSSGVFSPASASDLPVGAISEGAAQTDLHVPVAVADADSSLVDPSAITVVLSGPADGSVWEEQSLSVLDDSAVFVSEASAYASTISATGYLYALAISGNVAPYYGVSTTSVAAANPVNPISCINGDMLDATYRGGYVEATRKTSAGVVSYVAIGLNKNKTSVVDATLNGVPMVIGYKYTLTRDSILCLSTTTEPTYAVTWNANGAVGASDVTTLERFGYYCDAPTDSLGPRYEFQGWAHWSSFEEGWVLNSEKYFCLDGEPNGRTLVCRSAFFAKYAERPQLDISFDTSSEPADEGFPGIDKPDQTINVGSTGPDTVIEDPQRPGYVFQGWVLAVDPNDRELVHQDESGQWVVDSLKLPEYYSNDAYLTSEGKLQLTARWTSVISVDVPSRVTFFADVVTQGQGSREGLVQGAFAQAKAVNRSQVDLRIIGLESKAVAGEDDGLGADGILKRSDSATPASSAQKLLSLYPSEEDLTADDLKDPMRTSSLPDGAVGFDLDDVLLEASFDASDFTIPAGGELALGYRLNLAETGTELDYEALSSLDPGESAQVASVSYCFAADLEAPIRPSGNEDAKAQDPLWFELDADLISDDGSQALALKGVYTLADIKAAAVDIASHASDPAATNYGRAYQKVYDADTVLHARKADGSYVEMRIIGIAQDNKATGGKVGLTLQSRRFVSTASINPVYSGIGTTGWAAPQPLRTELASLFDSRINGALVQVSKYHQLNGGYDASFLQHSTEGVFLPSGWEVFGTSQQLMNGSEFYQPSDHRFQYQYYRDGGSKKIGSTTSTAASPWWLRSAESRIGFATGFLKVQADGTLYSQAGSDRLGVVPCFCL